MKFENTEVWGFEHAIRGMRNPMESWDKMDSIVINGEFMFGENDLKLANKLIKAGSTHRKFMRQIFVSVDITAPMFWWKEFDTYKVGTVRDSCSTMHTINVKRFTSDMFTTNGIDKINEANMAFLCLLDALEYCRKMYNDTKQKEYWRAIIELLPSGFNMRSTITMSYENILSMLEQRKGHKLKEWYSGDDSIEQSFNKWAYSLPFSSVLFSGIK